MNANPVAKRRRTPANVNRHIENFSLNHLDQFCLGIGKLIVQSAYPKDVGIAANMIGNTLNYGIGLSWQAGTAQQLQGLNYSELGKNMGDGALLHQENLDSSAWVKKN